MNNSNKTKLILYFYAAAILILFAAFPSPAKEVLPSKDEMQKIQTRVYETTNNKLVFNEILNVLDKEQYSLIHKDESLMYISAYKSTKIKDISKPLIAGYVLKTGFDTVIAFITYGLKSYNVACDILLIQTEFKEKDLVKKIGINVVPEDNFTSVKINIDEVLVGKRDGRPIGKNNKIRISHISDELPYKVFFFKLNKKLEEQKIKRVTL